MKNKNTTTNPQNNDDNCFQYALTVALNHQNIENNSQRISKIEPYVDQYNWKEIDVPSHSKDWKRLNKTIKQLLLMSYLYHTILKKIRRAYKSKHNFKRYQWHYLGVKRVPALLREIKSNHNGNFYCLKCFHSYSTKTKHKEHERLCNDHDYYYVEIPNEDNKISKHCP